MPKISIITINYNNLEGLKKTMDSIIGQTWKDFEYIIIDGGSNDGSVQYIESKKESINYWISEPDNGVYHAMNKGISKATGDYLLFLNSGDHLFNKTVLEQYEKFIDLRDIIYFNLNIFDGTKSYVRQYPEKLLFSYLAYDTLPHPATFIRRSLFEKVGLYDESYKIVSDWKFFIDSICRYNSSYIRVDQTLSTFYLDGMSSVPENVSLILEEKKQVLDTNFSIYLEDITELGQLKSTISNLRKSKKLQLLINLGLIKKI